MFSKSKEAGGRKYPLALDFNGEDVAVSDKTLSVIGLTVSFILGFWMVLLNCFYFYLNRKKLTAFEYKQMKNRFKIKPDKNAEKFNTSATKVHEQSDNNLDFRNGDENDESSFNILIHKEKPDFSTEEKKSHRKNSLRGKKEVQDQDDLMKIEDSTGEKLNESRLSKFGELPPLGNKNNR